MLKAEFTGQFKKETLILRHCSLPGGDGVIRKILMICVLLFSFVTATVHCETLVLPQRLKSIGTESFAQNTAITEVIIPNGAESIGDRAFFGCSSLGWITIPESIVLFGEDCFKGCSDDILIRTVPGSSASEYARSQKMDYQADTHYRALLIGQTYSAVPGSELLGPENDVAALQQCLKRFGDTEYDVSVRLDLSRDEMISSIKTAFGAATSNDVSLLYYSGHCAFVSDDSQEIALVGADAKDMLTVSRLRAALDQIPGRKIIIIDACYSGSIISAERNANAKNASQESESLSVTIADAFISAFSERKRANLTGDDYFVLASSAADEESYEDEVDGTVMGLFSAHLVKACTYENESAAPADTNGNGVITVQEMYIYTHRALLAYGQHVRVFPQDCNWFGILRME